MTAHLRCTKIKIKNNQMNRLKGTILYSLAGMTGVITSDCAVPYLDASYYAIILNSFLFVETGLI